MILYCCYYFWINSCINVIGGGVTDNNGDGGIRDSVVPPYLK